jgi:hypothetical protein
MTMVKSAKRVMLVATVIAVGATGLFWSGEIMPSWSLGLVTQAQARIGRPLTPLSYAGVARRTTRRAIYAGVRINVLPAGCLYGPYYGGHYWHCGGRYYEKSNNVYIQITFQ